MGGAHHCGSSPEARTQPAAVVLTNTQLFPVASPFQLEKYEGMRVHVDAVRTTSPTGGTVNEANARSTSTRDPTGAPRATYSSTTRDRISRCRSVSSVRALTGPSPAHGLP